MVEEGECSGDAKEEQGDVQLRGSRVVDEVSAGMALVSSTAVFNRIGGWRQGSKRGLAALGNGC
jgi:hypothetical protein